MVVTIERIKWKNVILNVDIPFGKKGVVFKLTRSYLGATRVTFPFVVNKKSHPTVSFRSHSSTSSPSTPSTDHPQHPRLHTACALQAMSAYLAEHVPHLQSLHVSLGLPPEALSSDQNQIETAIKNAVTTLIRNREGEVEGWRDSIADVKRSMVSLGRALGVKGKEAVTAARRESDSLEVSRSNGRGRWYKAMVG